jgi:molybdopterin-binding protein
VIALDDLSAERGAFALRAVTLTVPAGAYLVLLGPSGAGKSTLIGCIAGLWPCTGRVAIGGRDVTHEPPERRAIGLVTQDALLFPHLSVADNIGFALPAGERTARVRDVAELTGCTALLARRPASLSGGERQRVALARALARHPTALLLDEPLGALDAPVRRQLRAELRALQRRLGTTVIHVTHDLDEALAQATLLGVLDAGTLVQLGPPGEVFRRPVSRGVAALLGTDNLVAGEIQAEGDREPTPFPARLLAGTVALHGLAEREGPGYAAFRGEDVTLAREPMASSASNQLRCVVTSLEPAGALVRVVLDAGIPVVALVTRPSATALALAPGVTLYAHFKATAVHLI